MLPKRVISALLCVAVLVSMSACGGSGSSSTDGGSSSPAETAPASAGAEPSAEFAGKGPNGKLATLGKESTVEEREAASEVVEESLEAREARDWVGQCETLVASLAEEIEKVTPKGAGKASCAASLEAQGKAAPKAALANTMTGPIAALRVSGNRAFAFYHGVGGQDFVVPMEKEGGEWKLASISTQETP